MKTLQALIGILCMAFGLFYGTGCTGSRSKSRARDIAVAFARALRSRDTLVLARLIEPEKAVV